MKPFRLPLAVIITIVLVLFLITGSPQKTISQQGVSVCNPDICVLNGVSKDCSSYYEQTVEGKPEGNCLAIEKITELKPNPTTGDLESVECMVVKFYNCSYGQSSGGGFSIPGCPLGG